MCPSNLYFDLVVYMDVGFTSGTECGPTSRGRSANGCRESWEGKDVQKQTGKWVKLIQKTNKNIRNTVKGTCSKKQRGKDRARGLNRI